MNKINTEYCMDFGNVHSFPDIMNNVINKFIDNGYKFSRGSCSIIMSNNEEDIKITINAESEGENE